MKTARDFLELSRKELMAAMIEGHPIDPGELDDTEYRGVSLGLPRWVDRLLWKKFTKVFHRDPETGHLRGWNVRVVQDGLDLPWTPMLRRGVPRTFGHYRVVPAEGHRMPRPCAQGLLIHYGLGGNRRLDPMGRMRDPLVAVHPGRSDLLLGWSYIDLGFFRLGTPSFFTLERGGPLSRPVAPPRRPRRTCTPPGRPRRI